ncbi:chemotaxis protein MotC [Mesorhizobium sp. BAC0120]|uniref:chemotaxis protein MotC n=1 Tax=Mesorhizobium sp. BAC0120 TaxID=3090670 RepID=UPI00298C92D5|nr:chemotaxis protein MotC [Mesorhizobium sp. BAC0120]MDW6024431.1 chemotaxis protein MotC [Mesorhizobium sp. BAC0120]
MMWPRHYILLLAHRICPKTAGHFSVRCARATVTAFSLAGGIDAAFAQGEAPLEPYQMVRSLQLVQDRIASGDHAALPMQRKLLEMIDGRFRSAPAEEFADKRNYQALLVYAMSGGNPATIDLLLRKLHLDEADRALGDGILGYLNGDTVSARGSLDTVDPLKLMPEVGAFLALVKGSVAVPEDPKAALKMFDEARLLGTGTLVEEAALRRSIGLGAHNLDAARFVTISGQYARRFLYSPYANQFADAFVAGVVALHGTIDLAEVDQVIAGMDPERQKVIYLRLARRAAIDGIPDLAEYASSKADAVKLGGAGQDSDPRTLLYSGLATVTSATVDQVLSKLKGIDRSRLSESDLKLLEAAEAIAAEVTAPPAAPAEAVPNRGVADQLDREQAAQASVAAGTQDDLPEAEPIDAPRSADASPPAQAARSTEAAGSPAPPPQTAPPQLVQQGGAGGAAEQPGNAAVSGKADANSAGPEDAIVADTRKRLDEIDKLLKDTAQ